MNLDSYFKKLLLLQIDYQDEGVSAAYSDLMSSSKKTLETLLELQQAFLEKNPSISGSASEKHSKYSSNVDVEDEDWLPIYNMNRRIAPFRDKSIDKWQRKTQVTSRAAAIKGKLHAFNQNISEQIATYMRDPSKMIKQMRLRRSTVGVFGTVPEVMSSNSGELCCVINLARSRLEFHLWAHSDGDPELLSDSEFYQPLLKETFETIDPTSSESAFYALRKLQPKKRKIVDRRASKSRKIRLQCARKDCQFHGSRAHAASSNGVEIIRESVWTEDVKSVSHE